ncbi:MAG: hypothetical protein ABH837_00490 [bacterium]
MKEGQTKEERSTGTTLSIEEFLREPERFLNGEPYFQTVAPANGSIPENARGPFKGPNGNPNSVWVVPRADEFPAHMTGVHHAKQNSSYGCVTHPTCLECIELSRQIQDLPKIPHRAKIAEIRILVEEACTIRARERELLQSMMRCIAEVTSEIHPTNGFRALPNEIVMGDNPGTEFHAVFNSKGKVIKSIKVSRRCCHGCGSIKPQVAISALMTQQPDVVVSLERSCQKVELDDHFDRSSYQADSRDNH